MRYKKKIDEGLDRSFSNAKKHGMNVRFCEDFIFYRKGFHWEYLSKQDISQIYRRVEEVITHTSCCAENMDIQKLIITLKSGEVVTVHVCDGEPRLAEKLYEEIVSSWPDIKYGQ